MGGGEETGQDLVSSTQGSFLVTELMLLRRQKNISLVGQDWRRNKSELTPWNRRMTLVQL